jgi:predicted nucleic acid-binding Zn ribbon protein
LPEQLQEIFGRLDNGIVLAVRNCRLTALWPEVVDERVSKNTEAIKISRGTLYISASSPVWAQELSFLKRAIIKRFNERAGAEVISDIRFKAAG